MLLLAPTEAAKYHLGEYARVWYGMLANLALLDKILHPTLESEPIKQFLDAMIRSKNARVPTNCSFMKVTYQLRT